MLKNQRSAKGRVAIFHHHTQIIGRGKGASKMVNGRVAQKSSIAAAAYRAACRLVEKVVDAVTGKTRTLVHDYRNKKGLEHSEILAPEAVSKWSWVYDRQQLWGSVERTERRKDSQLAREFDLALPVELTREENRELLLDYVREVYVSKGMVADVNMHYDNEQNPHAHVMLTTRNLVIDKEGTVSFGSKNRSWNETSLVLEGRQRWAARVNKELESRGFAERISEKSYKELGIDLTPTVHEGPSRHMRGRLWEQNAEIQEQNTQEILAKPEILLGSIGKVVFTKTDLEQAFLAHLKQGMKSASEVQITSKYLYGLEQMLASDELVKIDHQTPKGEQLYTSNTQLRLEKEYIDGLKALNAKNNFMLKTANYSLPEFLSSKQKEVVAGVLEGQDISIIQGLPGVGKTTVMKAIADVYKEAGFTVVGTSTSSIATQVLAETAGIESRTVASWKYRLNQGQDLPAKTVFVIDEASMLDFDSAHRLLAKLQNSKVIMIGDTNQFGAIGIKGALNKAQEICGSLMLDEVRRQKDPLQREATVALGRQHIDKALELLDQSGAFKISEKSALNELVLDYVRDYVRDNKDSSNQHVALAFTNNRVQELNHLIRAKLIDGKMLALGREIKLGKSKILELSVGDQVLFCANNRDIGVLNGEIGKIVKGKIVAEGYANLMVQLGDRQVSFSTRDYEDLKLGYALTSHKSQGATYKTTKVLYEQGIKYHAFNVMMTRHTDSVGLYINRTDLLANTYSLKDQTYLRGSDLALLKAKLLEPLNTRESSLLASDYLTGDALERFNKVKQFIEVKNDIKQAMRSDYAQIRLDPIRASEFLGNVERRNQLATEIKDNHDLFKDFLAASSLSMELAKTNVKPDQKLEQIVASNDAAANKKEISKWYEEQKQLKEQALATRSKIILCLEQLDATTALVKEANYLKEVSQSVWQDSKDKIFKASEHEKIEAHLSKIAALPTDEQTLVYQQLIQDPSKLGKMVGFEMLGLKSPGRKEAISLMSKYLSFEMAVSKAKGKLEMQAPEQLRAEIQEMQKQLQKLEPQLAFACEFAVARGLAKTNRQQLAQIRFTAPKKEYLKFEDVHLNSEDYKQIFERCSSVLNPGKQVKSIGREVKCGSLTMNTHNGLWQRFSSGESGNVYGLVSEAFGMSKREALEWVVSSQRIVVSQNVPFKIEGNTKQASQDNVQDKWLPLKQVPQGITLDVSKDLSWMKQEIEAAYAYKDIEGRMLGYTVRCKTEAGCKEIKPLSYCVREGRTQWMVKGFGNHLYGLEKLKGNDQVLLVEGEKTADAAQQLFPDYVVLAFAGVSRTKGIDWSVLKDRKVVIWPDNDLVGKKAAHEIATMLGEQNIEVKIADLDRLKDLPEKWDLADELPLGLHTHELALALPREEKEFTKMVQDYREQDRQAATKAEMVRQGIEAGEAVKEKVDTLELTAVHKEQEVMNVVHQKEVILNGTVLDRAKIDHQGRNELPEHLLFSSEQVCEKYQRDIGLSDETEWIMRTNVYARLMKEEHGADAARSLAAQLGDYGHWRLYRIEPEALVTMQENTMREMKLIKTLDQEFMQELKTNADFKELYNQDPQRMELSWQAMRHCLAKEACKEQDMEERGAELFKENQKVLEELVKDQERSIQQQIQELELELTL